MKTIVAAYHNMGCAGIRALLRNGFEIQAIFTYGDDPAEAQWFESVARLGASENIPVFAPDDINHPIWVEKIRRMAPDMLFSFYYRDLIGAEILAIPAAGCLNLHGSLLPKYRGRAPINWALVNGERETGVTLHHMVAKADAGDVVCRRKVAIEARETALTLNRKLVAAADGMLDEYLPLIRRGEAPRTPQDHAQATCFGRRRPEDGQIDWSLSAQAVDNLVRAVTHPYPGAFTHHQERRISIWETSVDADRSTDALPGTVLDTAPLTVACGSGALVVRYAQADGDLFRSGDSLAAELRLARDTRLGAMPQQVRRRKTRVLILGINGFIGNALTERLLAEGDYEVHGMDLFDDAVTRFHDHPDFHFYEGDIAIHREWIEYQVKKCDVVLPLVAIATPIEYTRNPLKVFELDFEENLRIVRYCVRYGKRIVFPSTSEVYGMCDDPVFDEDRSRLILGPINKQRWIYSASKQLLDRVIWAYGQSEGLRFTLFRPFNWIGPRLDTLDSARIGSSRAITQMILNLVEGSPIKLIDGGQQKRCFTDVRDGVECLFRIIENRNGACDSQIINIGNPDNEASIAALAAMLIEQFEKHPLRNRFPPLAGTVVTESHRYYGDGYQDVQHRRPSIDNARRLIGWQPLTPMTDSIASTLDFFLRDYVHGADRAPVSAESSASQALV